jgi:ParB family chromosome partitioning protein
MTELVPLPGTDLVPDGWWEATVVPWADSQTEADTIKRLDAELAGFEAAWRQIDKDTLELTRARRYLEIRRGELLPPRRQGERTDRNLSQPREKLDHNLEHRLRQLVDGKPRAMEVLREASDAEQVTRSALLKAIYGAHVGANAGDNEWYTPREYIKAATAVMGAVDLDPASSEQANTVVGAADIFTEERDGLAEEWHGRVWMNPPYARPLVDRFCERLAESHAEGNVPQACVLVNNATETAWFHSLASQASAMCFPRGRVKFWHPRKESAPLQGQVVIYMGEQVAEFRQEFAQFGFTVML